MTTTSTIPTEIADFAARVRSALADLGADEVDDLTEGLEADLTEAWAEDLRRELPDPGEYAAELRLAAGLPQRGPAARRGLGGALASLRDGVRETSADVAVALRRNPATRGVLDFALAVRPLWWVARAWVATWFLAALLGAERGFVPAGPFLLVLLAAVVTSVQWGRGAWGADRLGPLLLVGNVVAAVLLLPAVAMADAAAGYVDDVVAEAGVPDPTGLWLGGAQVTNVFAYDAAGKPLRDVQLFDQDGRPLATAVPGGNGCLDASCTREGLWVARVTEAGDTAFNVFPLRMVEASLGGGGALERVPGAQPVERPRPFPSVSPVLAQEGASSEKVATRDE